MKKTVLLLLTVLMLLVPAHAVELEPEAPAALLMEKETGQVLWARSEHEPMEIASVTKVMTLLLTMEAIDKGAIAMDDVVSVSPYAASMGGSNVFLSAGEEITVEDLLKAVCVASGNDAAVALAEHISGATELFVEEMNNRAKELGMKETHFVNCTGLPAEGHLSSAWDVAQMSRELILHHPDIRRFTTIWMDTLRNGDFQLANTNKLIRFYDGATGLKTGSTSSAKFCLSATAERNGMELIAVVLKSPTSRQRFADARMLLDYGFATYTLHHLDAEKPFAPLPVTMGMADSVRLTLPEKGRMLLLKKAEAADLTQEVQLPESTEAPVKAGTAVGKLLFRNSKGKTVQEVPILTAESVGRLQWSEMFRRMTAAAFLQ